MEESKHFQKKADYESRKDLLIHYLKVLHECNKPISFSDLLLGNLPSGGISEFESVFTELESKKLIIKTEEDGGPVSELPFHRKVDRRYSISLEGVEYLASIGEINEKHKNNNDTKHKIITNYGNMVLGDNSTGNNQSSYLRDQRFSDNPIAPEPVIAYRQQIAASNINNNSPLKNIFQTLYKWTDHKLISGIILIILGFLISRILTWLGWL